MEIAWGNGFERDVTHVCRAAENCLGAGAFLGSIPWVASWCRFPNA